MAAERDIRDELESPALPGWPFALIAIAVLVFIGLSMGGLWAVFTGNVPDRRQPAAQNPPPPQLQTQAPKDLQHILSAQRARLAGYRWIDHDKKIAAIPIERAMAIIAQRGNDAYAPIGSQGGGPSAASASSNGTSGAPP